MERHRRHGLARNGRHDSLPVVTGGRASRLGRRLPRGGRLDGLSLRTRRCGGQRLGPGLLGPREQRQLPPRPVGPGGTVRLDLSVTPQRQHHRVGLARRARGVDVLRVALDVHRDVVLDAPPVRRIADPEHGIAAGDHAAAQLQPEGPQRDGDVLSGVGQTMDLPAADVHVFGDVGVPPDQSACRNQERQQTRPHFHPAAALQVHPCSLE